MTNVDIDACIALAREAKDDIDDIVRLAASSVSIVTEEDAAA